MRGGFIVFSPAAAAGTIYVANNGAGTVSVIDEATNAVTAIDTPMDLTITATGYDTPVLTESGTLPSRLIFTSTGNGQATISGTPARNTNGSRAITITATNQVGATSQAFTLRVRRS
ncbi:MAG: putative Ig domain-containing protein [Streptosporangiaceae bacterium]